MSKETIDTSYELLLLEKEALEKEVENLKAEIGRYKWYTGYLYDILKPFENLGRDYHLTFDDLFNIIYERLEEC